MINRREVISGAIVVGAVAALGVPAIAEPVTQWQRTPEVVSQMFRYALTADLERTLFMQFHEVTDHILNPKTSFTMSLIQLYETHGVVQMGETSVNILNGGDSANTVILRYVKDGVQHEIKATAQHTGVFFEAIDA